MEAAFSQNSLPTLESAKIAALGGNQSPVIWGNFLDVFAKAARNLKSLCLRRHNKAEFHGRAADIVNIRPFIENCSFLETIVLFDSDLSQFDEVMDHVWEKLPNLKFLSLGSGSKISKQSARKLILNYDSLILRLGGDFYFKSTLPLPAVKKAVTQQLDILQLRVLEGYRIFTF